MGEGDDGAQAVKKWIVNLFPSLPAFSEEWCGNYKEFGFQIEPQGPNGELSFCDAFLPTSERIGVQLQDLCEHQSIHIHVSEATEGGELVVCFV